MKLRWKILLGVAALCLLLAGGLTYEHYRLKTRCAGLRAALAAQGFKLAIPEAIPPFQTNGPNGSFAFLRAQGFLGSLSSSNQPGAMRQPAPGKARVAWQQPALREADNPDVWPGLAEELKDKQENLAELRAAIRDHPVMDFRPNYRQGVDMPLAHLARFKSTIQCLTAAVVFDLHERRTDAAMSHLVAGAQFIANFDNEATLISQLVRIACLSLLEGATWEALQSSDVTEAQWRELQAVWERTDVIGPADKALRMEMAFVCDITQRGRRDPAFLVAISSGGMGRAGGATNLSDLAQEWVDNPNEKFAELRLRLIWPYWTSYDEEFTTLQIWQQVVTALHGAASSWNFHGSLRALEKQQPDAEKEEQAGAQYLLGGSHGMGLRFLKRVATAETQRRVVITAIALKRYYLQHSRYPSALADLVPRQLSQAPVDCMDGQGLRYRPNPDGTFLLYSVGEDGRDDGGNTAPADTNTSITTFPRLRGKDWVWPQPASQEEVEAYQRKLLEKAQRR